MCKMYSFCVTRCVNGAELSHSKIISPYFSKTKPCALVAEHPERVLKKT